MCSPIWRELAGGQARDQRGPLLPATVNVPRPSNDSTTSVSGATNAARSRRSSGLNTGKSVRGTCRPSTVSAVLATMEHGLQSAPLDLIAREPLGAIADGQHRRRATPRPSRRRAWRARAHGVRAQRLDADVHRERKHLPAHGPIRTRLRRRRRIRRPRIRRRRRPTRRSSLARTTSPSRRCSTGRPATTRTSAGRTAYPACSPTYQSGWLV